MHQHLYTQLVCYSDPHCIFQLVNSFDSLVISLGIGRIYKTGHLSDVTAATYSWLGLPSAGLIWTRPRILGCLPPREQDTSTLATGPEGGLNFGRSGVQGWGPSRISVRSFVLD